MSRFKAAVMSGRSSSRLARVAVATALLMVATAPAASAEFGVVPGSFISDTFDPALGAPVTQAGAHPAEATTSFDLNLRADRSGIDGSIGNIAVNLPPGFVGNPEAAPKCARASFDAIIGTPTAACPVASQVGVARIRLFYSYPPGNIGPVPVYNLEPQEGQVADFGIPVQTVPVHMVASVDSAGNYGLRVVLTRLSQGLPIAGTTLTLWGVPSDSSHDAERACDGRTGAGGTCSVGGVRRSAFLTNPTECAGPQTSTIAVSPWADLSSFTGTSYTTATGITGCDVLRFEPRIRVASDSQRAGAPASYSVDIDIPQNDDPDGLATPPLRDAVVTMPAGTWISPSAADGLKGCSDEEFAYRSTNEPTCPDASKIGRVEVTTPLLPARMRGEIYLGEPQRGNLFRLFLVIRGSGLLFKVPGSARPNLSTGQITAVFDDNPPLPFSNLHLEFKGGPRATLSNPPTCGTATTTASMTAWGVDAPAQVTSSFDVRQRADGTPCASSFSPSLSAGLVNPAAGRAGTFTLTFARSDKDQFFRDVSVDMPPGLTGVLAAVTPCADAQASAGTCSGSSRIGSATNAAGPGANPFYLPGRVYLTGPYKGAPLGLSIVVPAIAGPFDLGTVVVRAAVFVDRTDASLRVVSDPLPTILEGVPLQIRSVNVLIDKPGFMLSPTNCSKQAIRSLISSVEGAVATPAARFQVGGCSALPFAPKMSLKVGAKGKLTRGKRTPLEVTLTMSNGQANNRSVVVTLPKTINARLDVVNKRRACTIEQFNVDRCPMSVGKASAVTPLLRDPLRGDAFFIYTPARRLPDLAVRLKGQVDVDLIGKVTITRDLRLRTTFDQVPDVPIRTFRLSLASGNTNGPIGITRNLCSAATRRTLKARLAFTAQSNNRIDRSEAIRVAGCSNKSSPRTARARRK